MTDVSAVALRTMGPRSILSGNGDALDDINTFELPDGATCFVIANRTNYRLDKESIVAPASPDIIAPGAGPGRWIAEGGGLVDALMFEANNGTNVFNTVATDNLVAISGSDFAARAFNRTDLTFTAAGCILTNVSLPARPLLVTVVATFLPEANDALVQIHSLAIDVSGDLIGADPTVTFIGGLQMVERAALASGPQSLTVQRAITALAVGGTIQPCGAYTDTQAVLINRLTMTVALL